MAIGDRLMAMKEKQTSAEQARIEAEQKAAAEKASAERETKRGELSAERERVGAELQGAEQEASAADSAIAEADAFATEQGENLAPEAKAEIDAIKVEAGEAKKKFETLKVEFSRIEAELQGLEVPAEAVSETPAEAVVVEAPTETAPAAEAPAEAPAAEAPAEAPAEATAEAAPDTEALDAKKGQQQEEYRKQLSEEFKKARPEIVARLRKEGVISESATTIPRKEYDQLVQKGFDERIQKGQLAEALMYKTSMELRLPFGGGTLEGRVASLDPKLFSEKLPELKQSLLTTEQQEQLDDILVRTYTRARDLQQSGFTLENAQINALDYVDQNPEKIDAFTDKIKKEMPTLEEIKDTESVGRLKAEIRNNEFKTRLLEYAKSAKIGEETGIGRMKFSEEDLVTLAKHFEGDIKSEYAVGRVAAEYLDAATEHMTRNEKVLGELGQKGEEALMAVTENYVDAFANYIKNGFKEEQEKKLSFTLYLKGAIDNLQKINDPDSKKRISTKLEQVITTAKGKLKSDVWKKEYEDVLKQLREKAQ